MSSSDDIDIVPPDAETDLIFFVNGKKVEESNPDPEWTLLWYLRRKLSLTGSKYGCGEGGCGACTVMVSRYNSEEDSVVHMAINACLTPVCAMHGLAITTVEGIGSTKTRLHPVQERIAMAHGSQCGFCTPGIVMSMYSLLRNNPSLDYKDLESALEGNLCRCTGYRPIIEGFKSFLTKSENNCAIKTCSLGDDCCKVKLSENSPKLFKKSSFQPYDPSQEPIFPPELKLNADFYKKYLYYRGENVKWFRPVKLNQALEIKKKYSCRITAGNTEIGVEMKIKKIIHPQLLSLNTLREVHFCHVSDNCVIIGASTSLTVILSFLQNQIAKNELYRCKIFHAIVDMLHWFAGQQTRNVASIGGNIITASPISDLNPILLSCGATVNIISKDRGIRKVNIDETFFKSYRETCLEGDEIMLSVEIPFSEKMQFFKAYKQSRRKSDDISIVTAAFNVKFELGNNTLKYVKLCFGGMGPKTLCAIKTSKLLLGMKWNMDVLHKAFDNLTRELTLDTCSPGGMVEYRRSLCLSFFFKFFISICENKNINGYGLSNEPLNAVEEIIRYTPTSTQTFVIGKESPQVSDAIGKPIVHLSALKHTTGEAIYCDDIPYIEGELFLALVFSPKVHAKVVSIDPSKVLSMPGVEAFFSAKDLNTQCNKIEDDEEIFSSELVTSRACIIGAVVAKTEVIAKRAAKLLNISFEEKPHIITLEEAISIKSFYSDSPQTLRKGNAEEALNNAEFKLEGFARCGDQEHFYLETFSALAVRKEEDIEITSSCQSPSQLAGAVSRALQIPQHKVIAKVKRIGGGFGGKETRPVILAVPVAIAAYKLGKPVRAVLDRDEDMKYTGHRHPYLIKYKVAFEKNGKIIAAIFNIFNNAGHSLDLSEAVNDRATVHLDNCYFIPNVEVNGYVCKTNIPSNTAFRGFGAPQAMLATESLIRDVADALNKSYEEVAEINMYNEGEYTHFNQALSYCTIRRCWQECILSSDYWQRKRKIEEYNRVNRWKKKGLALVPTKYGISFQTDTLMQGGALLLVYTDGSVLLTIGGIEMGQGLFTKMVQVVSYELQVDINKVHISETSTDKIPNSSPTAASFSSDMYGMAVMNACKTIKERLLPYKTKNLEGKWEDWVMEAYNDRVNLSATGFYHAPKIEYRRETNSGNLFEYFTYGVACSEVIIDCLTGDHCVLRTDIMMDIGESINPAIDIGQIEGAFMQGYGYYTLEELTYSPDGELLSKGPGAYKIPGFSDIPLEFNVALLKGAPNPRAVYSSKAVGEPPLFLASSVFFAIKEAIRSARKDADYTIKFQFDAPATCERIRMACEDEITKEVKATQQSGKPWNVVP